MNMRCFIRVLVLIAVGGMISGLAHAQDRTQEPTSPEAPTDQSGDQSGNQPDNQSGNQPDNQSGNQPDNQPGNPQEADAGGFEPPVLKTSAQAIYPERALQERVAARVVVELDIDKAGLVENATVVEVTVAPESGPPGPASDEYGFQQAAQVAAAQLTFQPARENGVAIPVRIHYTFNFQPPTEAPSATSETDVTDVSINADDGTTMTDSDIGQPAVSPPAAISFRGQVVERGTRAPLAGVTVTVYREHDAAAPDTAPQGFEASSDSDGRFVFYDLAAGPWQVVIEADGYYRAKTSETMAEGELVEGVYYIEKQSYNPYDVLVEAERARKEVNRRTLQTAEIVRVPGTLGDPILVVENLPGVARPSIGSGDIIVRGSGPGDTGVYIDGIAIPLIYHFGGLKSVVPGDVIESIDFYPGNFSVQYGRALGGIFDAHIKRLTPDRAHGSADLSLLDTSLFLEFPIGDNAAIAVAGRRSYVDVILNAAVPSDADVGLIQAPRYYDYQLLGNWRPKPAHDMRFLFLGSDDRIELLFSDPADEIGVGPTSGATSATTAFQRATAEYRYVPGTAFSNRLKFSVGRDIIDLNLFNEFLVDIDLWSVQARNTASFALSDSISLNAGIDGLVTIASGDVRAPLLPGEGEGGVDFEPGEFMETRFDNRIDLSLAPFIEAEWQLGPLRLVPGLRLDYFGQADTVTFDPRLVVRYQGQGWAAKAGIAMVHQAASLQETLDTIGNPDLEIQQGIQYSLGAEWQPLAFLTIDGTLFYKDLDNLVARTNQLVMRDGEQIPQVYDNSRRGRVYGGELYARHDFANNMRGWLSYTLSRAERFDRGDGTARLFDYDQTHIFAVVASYQLPRNWELGLRWRLVSGSPYTPATGSVLVNEDDEYLPIVGSVNSQRLPAFQQLDLRVDKTWVYDTWKFSAYLSVVNAYNRQNVESIAYNYDYSQRGSTNGLPIFPVLGAKGEW